MAMQQCPNGHLYDASQHSSCPFCANGSTVNKTMPLSDDTNPAVNSDFFPETMDIDSNANNIQYVKSEHGQRGNSSPAGGVGATMPIDTRFKPTEYLSPNEKGIAEVRGWLVCVEGEKKGVDFRIHGEKNTIGRGAENDIKLDFDYTISKGVNATIAYDNRNNKFYIYQSESKNNIYINNQLLLNPVELKDYDILEIGKTKMIFRSLCNEAFTWELNE